MSIGKKWKEIISVTDRITYSFHVIFLLWSYLILRKYTSQILLFFVTAGWFQEGKKCQKPIQCVSTPWRWLFYFGSTPRSEMYFWSDKSLMDVSSWESSFNFCIRSDWACESIVVSTTSDLNCWDSCSQYTWQKKNVTSTVLLIFCTWILIFLKWDWFSFWKLDGRVYHYN